MTETTLPTSTWVWPHYRKVAKKFQPLGDQNCVRVFRNTPLTVAVQIRFIDSYAHMDLKLDQARELAALLIAAAEKHEAANAGA